jgi:hypothetical protein
MTADIDPRRLDALLAQAFGAQIKPAFPPDPEEPGVLDLVDPDGVLLGWQNPNEDWRYTDELPRYSTTGDGMLLVVEAMRVRGWEYGIHASDIGQHKAEFSTSGADRNRPFGFAFAWADTAPLAVALAACRALGVTVE